MKNDNRIYWVNTHRNGQPYHGDTGKNAKRDAHRRAKNTDGKVLRMTGKEWDTLCAKRK